MTRAAIFAFALGLAALISCLRAGATTEFCPAVLDYAPIGSQNVSDAQTYGIQLRALSQRRITARVVFDTNAGWYQADIPETMLSDSMRTIPLKYPVDISLATSPILYVRFPSAVHVNHAFVTRALSIGDIFHWSERGEVTCPIAPEAWPDPKFSLADFRGLAAPPARDATTLAAKPRSPLEPATCREDFSPPKPLKAAQAVFPDAARAVGASGTAVIGIAVDPNGTVADTWVQGSTDDETLDAAAQTAAQATTFQGARAYCQSVPSIYFLIVTFDARS